MKSAPILLVLAAVAAGVGYYAYSTRMPAPKFGLIACTADVTPEAQQAWLAQVNSTLMNFKPGEKVAEANAARPFFTSTGWSAYIKSAQDAGYIDAAGVSGTNIRLTGLTLLGAPVLEAAPDGTLPRGPWVATEQVMLSAERSNHATAQIPLDLDVVFGCSSESGTQPFAVQQVIGKAATH